MLLILLMFVGDLQLEANQAFASHAIAQNAEQVRSLEASAKVAESSKERQAIRKTVREAKSGKVLLKPAKDSFRSIVTTKTRNVGTPDPLYVHNIQWHDAKAGDLIFLDFSYHTETGGRADDALKNLQVVSADAESITTNPINWQFGKRLTEIVPNVDQSTTIRIVDGGQYKPREGQLRVDGEWYVARVEGGEITIVWIDPFEIERIAKEQIAAANTSKAK